MRSYAVLKIDEEFTPAERLECIHEVMSSAGKTFSATQLKSLLGSEATLQPLFLRTLLKEVQAFGSFETLDAHLAKLLASDDAVQLYQLMFARLEADLTATLAKTGIFATSKVKHVVGAILGLICFSPTVGLFEEEILAITKLPQVLWASLFAQIEEHLTSSGGMLFPQNAEFTTAVQLKYLAGGDSASFFCQEKLLEFFSLSAPTARRLQVVPRLFLHLNDPFRLTHFISDPIDLFTMVQSPLLKQELIQYWKFCQQHNPQLPSLIAEQVRAYCQSVREIP